jgi:tetratricopeptide (TPR) repeat protein
MPERRTLLARATALGATRRLAECESLCRLVLEHDPHDRSALRLLAWAQYERGASIDAERSARAWLSVEPESTDACRALGRALARSGREREAIALLRRCAANTGEDEDRARLARVLGTIDEHRGEALALVRERARSLGADASVRATHQWLRAAVALDHRPSIAVLSARLVALAPDDGAMRASCAAAMLRVGDVRSARAHAIAAIERRPNTVLAWSVRASACRALGLQTELLECESALASARTAAAPRRAS